MDNFISQNFIIALWKLFLTEGGEMLKKYDQIIPGV